MNYPGFPQSLRKLVNELSKLPSIGERSALRLAYHLIVKDKDLALRMTESIAEALAAVALCKECFSLAETNNRNEARCEICLDTSRNPTMVCVVEKPVDVLSIERSGQYRGLYHVLHGLWSPVRGITPEMLKFNELLTRIKNSNPRISEVILATGTTVEGDATALYLGQALAELQVQTTRLAQGLPKGGDLEYVDDVTLSYALSGRQELGKS
ncbi:recombination protein RecR [bacterium]|nr:recombination protein RecR [bacterium]